MLNKRIHTDKEFKFHETSFRFLMNKRIKNVLIICSNYDFYMLKEDGRIEEQVQNEYFKLKISQPPNFIHAENGISAFAVLQEQEVDLVITMLTIGNCDAFELSRRIKQKYKHIPIVVLTPFSREVSLKIQDEDLSAIDYVFCWLGNADILLAIIKLLEDKMNLEYDLGEGVQAILLVEDSIRFYSSYLPVIYKIVLKQSAIYMADGLNEDLAKLSMRGRPKILLATNFEEALELYENYGENLLGVISDVCYEREGKKDKFAGFKFAELIRKKDKNIAILLQSSDLENQEQAKRLDADFMYKYTKTLTKELRNHLFKKLQFGDFIFRDPETGKEIKRAANICILQKVMGDIPIESRKYHFNRNDLSLWLKTRALFPIAEKIKNISTDKFQSIEETTDFLISEIKNYRFLRSKGVIARFERESYDEYLSFVRIGKGSLGGKARGLAFIDALLKRNNLAYKYENTIITIPRTLVLTTDIFEEFMERNDLYKIALSEQSDEQILEQFVQAKLSDETQKDLKAILNVVKKPLAIRSSSVLEDSHYQPFAGIYSTYMIPNLEDKALMLELILKAIKSVYASVYFKNSKAYMEATSNVIDEEQMAIIIQEVCGTAYEGIYYPTLSGVARSINFYPIPPEKADDGIVGLGFGLGKIAVEGGVTMRFSPKYPKKILQLSSAKMALRETQSYFYALDLNPDSFKTSINDGINIQKLKIKDAEQHNSMKFVCSTYDYQNDILRAGMHHKGRRVITFSNILNHNSFPLAKILEDLLEVGEREMNTAIEIEFAVNLDRPKDAPKIFNLLQIRPIVEVSEQESVDIKDVELKDTIIFCKSALGNGELRNIKDFVYIKPESWNPAKSVEIADRIEKINRKFIETGSNYILVGPGRWGSSDPWLGIPVKWAQISAARLIVESGLENFQVDPSQGTHFFQNLTSFRVGYFTINPFIKDGFYDLDYLAKQEVIAEDEYIRHVRFQANVLIRIDGKKNIGVIYKPNSIES